MTPLPFLPLARVLLIAGLVALSGAAVANTTTPLTLELSASAEARAANDVVRATLYYEATHRDPAKLADEVNRAIRDALDLAAEHDEVKTRSAGTSTWPVHSKDGRKIEAWRMRSSIQVESEAIDTVSTLLGDLQQTLALASLSMEPAAHTRAAAADAAALEALDAFQARAETLAERLGSGYRIRHINVQHDDRMAPPQPMMRSAMMAAESAPAPLEAGETSFGVSIHGTIEILE